MSQRVWPWPRLQKRTLLCIALFAIGFAVYASVAGSRLARQSSDPHFVLQADAWLNGSLSVPPPWKGDDPAVVETVLTRDGRELRGRYLSTRGWQVGNPWFDKVLRDPGRRPAGNMPTTRFFQSTRGEILAEPEIARSLGKTNYMSFPPFPSVLMLPQTALHGRAANDVFPTVLVAALILPLCFSLLRRLADSGLSDRSLADDLWLTALLAFGTVLFFCSVQGRVWFTAHVVAVALCLGYCHCAIGARQPIAAGILLGLATLSRTPMAFMFPLFLLEAWRVGGGRSDLQGVVRLCIRFAVPVLVLAIAAGIHNYLRFDSFGEFGHSYLAVRQQPMIEEHGLFDYAYLRRNLSVAFTLLPGLSTSFPYVLINGHGLALWVTTPVFLLLLWPRTRGPLHRPLWITVACVAVPILCYQNSGWIQFGYRFSLDYTVFLVLLLALGGRPLTRWSKGLIALGIVINLFGAVTFARHMQFYDMDSYNTVIPHHPR